MCGVLTCPRASAVDQRLRRVSEDDGSYTVEAVFLGVILQSRLIGTHRVVRTIAAVHYQLRDTELLLQCRDGGAVACGLDNKQSHKPLSVPPTVTLLLWDV